MTLLANLESSNDRRCGLVRRSGTHCVSNTGVSQHNIGGVWCCGEGMSNTRLTDVCSTEATQPSVRCHNPWALLEMHDLPDSAQIYPCTNHMVAAGISSQAHSSHHRAENSAALRKHLQSFQRPRCSLDICNHGSEASRRRLKTGQTALGPPAHEVLAAHAHAADGAGGLHSRHGSWSDRVGIA